MATAPLWRRQETLWTEFTEFSNNAAVTGGIGLSVVADFPVMALGANMMESSRIWSGTLPATLPVVSLNIFCDVEHLSACSMDSLLPLLSCWQQRQLPCVMESLFPEVRTLAYIAANGGSPSTADWLAARVVVFQLEHVVLGRGELTLMDAINRSLRSITQRLGLELASLQSFAVASSSDCAVAATGRSPRQAKLASPVAQSLQLRQDLAAHLGRLQAVLS